MERYCHVPKVQDQKCSWQIATINNGTKTDLRCSECQRFSEKVCYHAPLDTAVLCTEILTNSDCAWNPDYTTETATMEMKIKYKDKVTKQTKFRLRPKQLALYDYASC